VVIPRGVIDVHETDAAFDHAASEEAITGEGSESSLGTSATGGKAFFIAIDAVHIEGFLRFAGEIDEFRG